MMILRYHGPLLYTFGTANDVLMMILRYHGLLLYTFGRETENTPDRLEPYL